MEAYLSEISQLFTEERLMEAHKKIGEMGNF